MLEHAIYSVISPEGAASILWRDSQRAKDAATAMKITAQDLKRLNIIDEVIPEPMGGAHRARGQSMAATGEAIAKAMTELSGLPPAELKKRRRDKFIAIGRSL
jgi:acetyl-CoA carboxylase carboxyl transferase subunit alpha